MASEEEEVTNQEDRGQFPSAEADMVLEEDLEAILQYAIIVIDRDT